MHRHTAGFTLIEAMVVVAVVAILSALALPAYSRYVMRARRTEGREALLRLAAAQEKYLNAFNRYATSIDAAPGAGGLGLHDGAASENGFYTIALQTGTDGTTYTLKASPADGSPQSTDACGTLAVDNALNKSFDGAETNGRCW